LVIEGRPNTLIINTNYDIAEKYGYLPDEIKNEIEDDKLNRPGLYRHKWMGEPNSLERRVYKDWIQIDEVPHEARLERRGLDFGYSVDPTAIVAIYRYNDGYIIDEEVYRKGMKNNDIAAFINNTDNSNTLVIADSAEPKSIADLQEYGVNVLGVKKVGGDDPLGNKKTFKQYGIDFVGQQRISVTKRSSNIWREYMSYLHKEDRDGKILNDPEDGNDHAMDALMYGFMGLRPKKEEFKVPKYVPSNFMTG
jgi:phage terminase large subunit